MEREISRNSNYSSSGAPLSKYAKVDENGEIKYEDGPTFRELMEERSNKPKIVAKKMYKNAIAEVKFDDGRVMDIDSAVEFAKESGIENTTVGRARNGRQILRANPTDDPDKSLSNLPTYH